MAAIVLKNCVEFSPRSLYDHIAHELPMYAVPVFIRLLPAIDTTTTFKHKKVRILLVGRDYFIYLCSH